MDMSKTAILVDGGFYRKEPLIYGANIPPRKLHRLCFLIVCGI